MKKNPAARYSRAKELLKQARRNGDVFLVWYNGYTLTRTLKVLWDTPEGRRRWHRKLVGLADSWDEGGRHYGGYIYRFAKED